MAGYTKLFSSITDSTVWREPDRTRLVWITMLAMADSDGYVAASVPGLADRARVPMEDCLTALEAFRGPDEWSRTKDYEGRRIVDVDGGWQLLNHAKYRAIQDADHRREQSRLAMQRLRAERKSVSNVSNVSNVSEVNTGGGRLTQAEAEAEAEEKSARASCEVSGNPKDGSGTRYGLAARAMRQQGCDANPAHPVFRALVDQGASIEEFEAVAAEASEKGKPFGWAIGALKGRRKDAENTRLSPVAEKPGWNETRQGVSHRARELGKPEWIDFEAEQIRQGKIPSWDRYLQLIVKADQEAKQ